MKQCPQCGVRFRDGLELCPIDGTALNTLADPLIGRVVQERYVIEELIGIGGMGSVYKGRHQTLGRYVALKFLAQKLTRDENHKQRFMREARAAGRVQHEHIINVTDVGETDDGLAYMVMEYLTGKTLSDDVEQGALNIERACRIAIQLAFALARAHELGVVHRDIKPGNIFLTSKGGDPDFVKLLDFGLARAQDDVSLTKSNALFGTPEYMAPEQANGGTVGAKADLYALGCVLFEMITGRLPFQGAPTGLIYKHVYEPPPKPQSLRAEIPDALELLVLKLLHKNPDDRHASAYELADELTRIAAALPRETPSAARAPSESSQRVTSFVPAVAQPNEEDRWQESLEHLRTRISAVGSAKSKTQMLSSVERVATLIRDVQTARRDLSTVSVNTAERHEAARGTRLRLGAAIDALAVDESRCVAECDGLQAELKSKSERLEREARRLVAAVHTFDQLSGRSVPALDHARFLLVASDWSKAQEEVFQVQERLLAKEVTRADLRFQISHLKGRLAGLDADSSASLEPAEARAVQLEAQISAKLYAIRLDAERITEELKSRAK